MNAILVIMVVICSCAVCHANVALVPTPSWIIPIGNSLKLSCSVTNRQVPVMWRKDGFDIGEDCKVYRKIGFTCEEGRNGDGITYHLKIKAITLADAGNWSCSHGPQSIDTVKISVTIPTKVYPLKIYNLPQHGSSRPLLPGSSSFQPHQAVQLNGVGTLKQPIDLTNGPRDWAVSCRSTCGSSARNLRWELLNKTWLGYLNPPNDRVPSDDCPDGQDRITQTIKFSCLHGSSYKMGRSSKGYALVGLNRIICAPNHGNLNDIIEASHTRTGAENSYFQWPRKYTSSLWPATHRFSTSVSGVSVQQEEQFECTARTGELPFACVHILCPGNPTEWFTWGERVALVVSAILFLMVCLFLCFLTRHRKQAKQRSNIAPGQQHEVELML